MVGFFVFLGFLGDSLWAKEKTVEISLIQILGNKKKGGSSKNPVIDPKLKKHEAILKNLKENYFYQFYKLVGEETQKAAWNETLKYKLYNKMTLEVTPHLKDKSKEWVHLKILIKCPKKDSKKGDEKVEYKKVVSLVQKLKHGATFLVRLKIKGGVLFLALKALDLKKKADKKS